MTDGVQLRDVWDSDLPVFFAHQQDAEANRMAAFTSREPADWDAFLAHWTRIRGDASIVNQTIVAGGAVAGHIARFVQDGEPEVTYWLGREYWGRGIATDALSQFLRHEPMRPLFARAAQDNAASLRVLQKCGFVITGEDSGFAHARGRETAEFILTLQPDERRVP